MINANQSIGETTHSELIVHLSDIHFGRADERILQPLVADIRSLKPTIVVISGDLTMRARRHEFLAAREFLDALPCPWISVPGNHDVPAWQVGSRLLKPYARYRLFICDDLMPKWEDEHFAIIGLNSARRGSFKTLDWSRGRLSTQQLDTMTKWFDGIDPEKPRIVFAHHPFILPEQSIKRGLVGGLSRSLEAFSRSRVNLILAGHLHQAHWSITTQRNSSKTSPPILALQASTATSSRLKGEPNSFNTINVGGSSLRIGLRSWNGSDFEEKRVLHHNYS